MSSLIVWITVSVCVLALIFVAAGLRAKNTKLIRQLARVKRYRADFENRPIHQLAKTASEQIPTLVEALAHRDDFLKNHNKKRTNKQRRLVSRLKSGS